MNDYLIHYNHNHDALGRFARSAGSASSAVGSKLTSRKKEKSNVTRKYESNQRLAAKKKKASEAVAKNKQKGSKSNNTKLSDSERKRLIESASLKEVTANKDKLSNRELGKAIERLQKEKANRIDLEKKLYDLNKPDNQKNRESAMAKIERLGKNANTLAEAINSGTKLYNNAAMVYNLGKPKDKQLPRIGNDKDGNKTRSWVQDIINSGDAVKAAKYANQMTADERKKVIEGIRDVNAIKKMADSANKKPESSSSSSTTSASSKPKTESSSTSNASFKPKAESSSSSNTSSKPKSNPTIETYDNQEDYERAVRVQNNYGTGGWKNYDSQGREWTSYDYKPSNESSSNSSSSNSSRPESWADVRKMMEPKANENSRKRANEVLERYPDYNDDWKKRKSRY